MMVGATFLSLAFMAIATPLPVAAQSSEQIQASPQRERRICRNVAQSTGSIFGNRRVCRTESQERRTHERSGEGQARTRGGDTARSSE